MTYKLFHDGELEAQWEDDEVKKVAKMHQRIGSYTDTYVPAEIRQFLPWKIRDALENNP
jgi:acyl carrier protein phosphodiesterase